MSKQLRAILALPFMVTVIIPTIIVARTRAVHPGWRLTFPVNILPITVGVGLIALGVTLLVGTIRMFATIGKGTLAPWNPTQKLVVAGVYRYVRNPMISGVVAILLGEAVALGSPPLFIWCALGLGINIIYIPLVEEPGLVRRFGNDYRIYLQNVPRWIPRLKPWIPPA